jgi:hypothetical protein
LLFHRCPQTVDFLLLLPDLLLSFLLLPLFEVLYKPVDLLLLFEVLLPLLVFLVPLLAFLLPLLGLLLLHCFGIAYVSTRIFIPDAHIPDFFMAIVTAWLPCLVFVEVTTLHPQIMFRGFSCITFCLE